MRCLDCGQGVLACIAPTWSRILPTWPETILFGQAGAAVENYRKTAFSLGEIAKDFWPLAGRGKFI
jgi:hypothetical protein